jgi:hypothetical protein
MIMKGAMTRALTFAVALLCNTAAAAPLVSYESPCECRDNHGKHRWAAKNDPALPPSDASAIQPVTPSDIFNWQGPEEHLTSSSERIVTEQKWYDLPEEASLAVDRPYALPSTPGLFPGPNPGPPWVGCVPVSLAAARPNALPCVPGLFCELNPGPPPPLADDPATINEAIAMQHAAARVTFCALFNFMVSTNPSDLDFYRELVRLDAARRLRADWKRCRSLFLAIIRLCGNLNAGRTS